MFSWTWATGTFPARAGSIRLNTMTRENGDLITTKELNGLFKRVGHHHLHINRYHQRVKVFTLSPLSGNPPHFAANVYRRRMRLPNNERL
jgi:tRNA1(Val) A37 N6-methylase TrmN6